MAESLVLPSGVAEQLQWKPCAYCDGEGIEYVIDTHPDSAADADGLSLRTTQKCPMWECVSGSVLVLPQLVVLDEPLTIECPGSDRVPLSPGNYDLAEVRVWAEQIERKDVLRGDHRVTAPGLPARTATGLLWLPPAMFDALPSGSWVLLLDKPKEET